MQANPSRAIPSTPKPGTLLAAGCVFVALLGCKQISDLKGDAPAPLVAASGATAGSAAPTEAAPAGGDSGLEPLPFAVGQWAKYTSTRGGAPSGGVTYRVTGVEDTAYWIDMEIANPGHGAANVSVLMDFKGKRTSKDFSVRKAKIKLPTGQVHTLSGVMLDAALKGFSAQLANLAVDSFEGLPKEDVKVPAGDFSGCYYRDFDFKVMNIHSKGRVWNHSKVPISAMIKNESTTNGEKVLFVLEAYGTEAAP